jgi:hypothetical protein
VFLKKLYRQGHLGKVCTADCSRWPLITFSIHLPAFPQRPETVKHRPENVFSAIYPQATPSMWRMLGNYPWEGCSSKHHHCLRHSSYFVLVMLSKWILAATGSWTSRISLTQKMKGVTSEFECVRSRDISVGIVTDDGFDSRQWQIFSLLYTACGPPSLLYNGYRGVKLTTRLRLVPRSRISGAIPLLPNTSSRCGAYLWTWLASPFTFTFTGMCSLVYIVYWAWKFT